MRRLYLHLYLAFLVVALVSLVGAGGLAWLLGGARGLPPEVAAIGEILVEDLPDHAAEREARLRERARRFQVEIGLYAPDGTPLARTDPGLPGPPRRGGSRWVRSEGRRALALRLADRRWAVIRPEQPVPHVRDPLLWLGSFGLLVALGCYPVARRITRRLEALEEAVTEIGAGDLSARVPVEGRDEVAQLAEATNRAAERIEALVEAQRRMLAAASHELRSPLARLRLALELIAEDPRRAERRLAEAERNIAELDDLVEEILLAARLDRPLPLRRGPVDLDELLRSLADEAGAEVHGSAGEVQGDRSLLRRLLANLLRNAVQHGARPIRVLLRPPPDNPVVVVEDSGPGVPPERREEVFAPFVHGAGEGAGLGLALVRAIARRHGGEVRLGPVRPDGTGARFELHLGQETS